MKNSIKNYIPLLVSLMYASAVQAAGMPTQIRIYNTVNDAKQQQNENYATVGIEQDTTTNHVRDELLREAGAGHLIYKGAESFSADPNSNKPLTNLYGKRRVALRPDIERDFIYLRFDFSSDFTPEQLDKILIK
jgi:hypothetical protein